MKIDPIQQYKKLRQELLRESGHLTAKLADIEATLNDSESTPVRKTPVTTAPRAKSKTRRGRGGNATSLKQGVIEVLAEKTLTKSEILAGVQENGYKFTSKNPANSLGVILYGKDPKFNNDKGNFSLGAGAKSTSAGKKIRVKRTLSSEARAKIAAAQKKRWKKVKKAAASK